MQRQGKGREGQGRAGLPIYSSPFCHSLFFLILQLTATQKKLRIHRKIVCQNYQISEMSCHDDGLLKSMYLICQSLTGESPSTVSGFHCVITSLGQLTGVKLAPVQTMRPTVYHSLTTQDVKTILMPINRLTCFKLSTKSTQPNPTGVDLKPSRQSDFMVWQQEKRSAEQLPTLSKLPSMFVLQYLVHCCCMPTLKRSHHSFEQATSNIRCQCCFSNSVLLSL